MGEVYRARDSRLERDVALKVFPGDLAGDRERLARFQREAEDLASLNHPHIAQIYGFEKVDEASALVMELVEGEDVARSRAGHLRSRRPFRSRSRSLTRSRRRTNKESSIAI